jgi:hypothetical protein
MHWTSKQKAGVRIQPNAKQFDFGRYNDDDGWMICDIITQLKN